MTPRMAIIGLGIMGRRMLENALQHPAFEVCGAWDPSAASVAKTLETMPGVTISPDPQAAMAGADVVYLACPPGPRKTYALQAAAAAAWPAQPPPGSDASASHPAAPAWALSSMPFRPRSSAAPRRSRTPPFHCVSLASEGSSDTRVRASHGPCLFSSGERPP